MPGDGLVGEASWGSRYGTRDPGLRADSVCHLFAPVAGKRPQILDPRRGTLMVKLAGQVHSGPLQWQPFELRAIALELGWLACDYQVRTRSQLVDPKWIRQRHVRRGATFWMAFHTGPRCPSRGLPLRDGGAAGPDDPRDFVLGEPIPSAEGLQLATEAQVQAAVAMDASLASPRWECRTRRFTAPSTSPAGANSARSRASTCDRTGRCGTRAE